METRFSGHGAYRTEYHVVWIPKYRRRILNPGVSGYISKLFPKILREMPGVEMVEINIQRDHIHAIMIIPPKYAVSEVIGRIKGRSASMLRKKFAWLGKVYWKENIVWSPGYFVSTIGIDEKQIMRYVQWQGHQDSGQAKLDL
ncbi:MAG: IS200/IS605 family transposase [Desulfobacteria bacterium]